MSPCISHLTKNVSPPFILLVAPTMYGLPCPFPQPYRSRETLSIGEESHLATKKMFDFRTRKTPLTKEQFSCNHPKQASFITVVIDVVSFFLTSGFMHRYIMLLLITQWLLNLICSMTKALKGQNSSK